MEAAVAPPTVERVTGRAMGTTATIEVVDGPAGLAAAAWEHLADLERRWSRFLPDSELSRLNAADGHEVLVSAETFTLVAHAVTAWSATGGRFDPTVLGAVRALGYDRTWREVPDEVVPSGSGPAPGCAGIVLHRGTGSVQLPAGVTLDPGGIGKGLAADLVTTMVSDAGADGSLVDVGGDIRVHGRAPDEAGWSLELDHGRGRRRLMLADGGLATSGTSVRRWRTPTGTVHHVIDPATGTNPTRTPDAVTVVAGTAWWAEALATALLVDPHFDVNDLGAAAWISDNGATTCVGDTEAYD